MKKSKNFLAILITLIVFSTAFFLSASAIKGDGICNTSSESWWNEPGKINALDNPQTNVVDDCLPPPSACCVYQSCSAFSTEDVEYFCQPDDKILEKEKVNIECWCFDSSGHYTSLCSGVENCKKYPVGGGEGFCNEGYSFYCETMKNSIHPLNNPSKGFYTLGCSRNSSCWAKTTDKMMDKYLAYEKAQEEYENNFTECTGYCSSTCSIHSENGDNEKYQECAEGCYASCDEIIEPEVPSYNLVNLNEKCIPRGEVPVAGEPIPKSDELPRGFCSEKIVSCSEEERSIFPSNTKFKFKYPYYDGECSGSLCEPVNSMYFTVHQKKECFCPFEYIGTTIRVDPVAFRKKYCQEEGCVLDYDEYIQPEKVDFERRFNASLGELVEINGDMKPMGAMEEVGGKMRTIVAPGDSIECIAEFNLDKEMCLGDEGRPTAKIKLGNIGEKNVECYHGKASYTALDSQGNGYPVDGYRIPSLNPGDGYEYWKIGDTNRWFRTKEGMVYLDYSQFMPVLPVEQVQISNNWFCPASFATYNPHRGKNNSCEVLEIKIGGAKISGKDQPDKEKYVSEDLVIARYVYHFASINVYTDFNLLYDYYGAKGLSTEIINSCFNTSLDKEGFHKESLTIERNFYQNYKEISEINQKIQNSGKALYLFETQGGLKEKISKSLNIFPESLPNFAEVLEGVVLKKSNRKDVFSTSLGDTVIFNWNNYAKVGCPRGIKTCLAVAIPDAIFINYNQFRDVDREKGKKTGDYYRVTTFSHEMGHRHSDLSDEYDSIFHRFQSKGKSSINPFPSCCLEKNGKTCGTETSCPGMPYETNWETKDEIPPGNEPVPFGPLRSIMGSTLTNNPVIYPTEASCPLRNC